MKQLLFMRHGQSEANAKGVYAGINPTIQLTELGRAQAVAAGEVLKDQPVDVIIASPLDRAQATAKIVAGQIGYSEQLIITDQRLHEVDVGKLMGQPDHGFVEYLKEYRAGTNPAAETPEDVLDRLHSWLVDAAARYPDKVVLIVSHAGVGRALCAILTGVGLEAVATLDSPNAEAFELPLDNLDEVVG
jgi:broad specificity phosphatase PhoE